MVTLAPAHDVQGPGISIEFACSRSGYAESSRGAEGPVAISWGMLRTPSLDGSAQSLPPRLLARGKL